GSKLLACLAKRLGEYRGCDNSAGAVAGVYGSYVTSGSCHRGLLLGHANRSLRHVEPVSDTPKRKLKIRSQRLTPRNRQSKARNSEIARQRLGSSSLARGNVAGSHTAGYRMAETGLCG